MPARAVVVVIGGGPVAPGVVAGLPEGAPVVAADSGVDLALALGLAVDVVVGDLDSVSPAGLAAARAAGARVEVHPAEKDETDLALAMTEALACMGPEVGEVVVLGGAGGRLDHLLAGVLALSDPSWSAGRIRAHLGPATVHVLHGPAEREVGGATGDLLTIVPVGGPATGVTTEGLAYSLRDEDLPTGTTRGVSNVVADAPARVGLRTGCLLVIQPGPEPPGGNP